MRANVRVHFHFIRYCRARVLQPRFLHDHPPLKWLGSNARERNMHIIYFNKLLVFMQIRAFLFFTVS